MEQKFYICEHCGNIIAKVKDAGVPVMCCGQKMTEIVPGTTDAAAEKHIPVYQAEGNIVTVRVGSVDRCKPSRATSASCCTPAASRPSALRSVKETRSRRYMRTATCMGSGRRKAIEKSPLRLEGGFSCALMGLVAAGS